MDFVQVAKNCHVEGGGNGFRNIYFEDQYENIHQLSLIVLSNVDSSPLLPISTQ